MTLGDTKRIVNDNTLIIGLSVALLLAVGWVVFFVGRVVICIIRDARAARRPPRQLQHPEFGTLTFDSSLWSGQVQRDGRDIRFTIAGTESEPDSRLFQQLRTSISRLPELEKSALEFVRSQQPEVQQGDFT